MKFTLTFKDPDMDIEDLAEVMQEQTGRDYYDFISQWTGGEYITVQFDTEAGTCVVLNDGDSGVNDHWKKPEVIATFERQDDIKRVEELKRQLDEALDTLSKEEDKSTPYAVNLLKFIMDTRDQIKYYDTLDYDDPETYPDETTL